jgi:transposase-like protein
MEYTPRRKLTREFKLEAVRQTALSEKPKAQVARERPHSSYQDDPPSQPRVVRRSQGARRADGPRGTVLPQHGG